MDEYKLPTITPENYFFKFIVWEFQTIFDQPVYIYALCQIHTIRINPALLMGHSGPFEYIMHDSVNFLSVLRSFCIRLFSCNTKFTCGLNT